MGWMDVSIIVILIINGIKGWIKGLILSLFSIATFIVSGILAKMYYPTVSKFIVENSNVFSTVKNVTDKRIELTMGEEMVPESIIANRNIFQVLQFPKGLEDFFMKSQPMEDFSLQAMENVHHYVSEILTKLFIDFLSILIIFFVVKIVFSIVGHILNSIATWPILKECNSIGGMTFGLVKGLIIVFIVLALITPVVTMTNQGVLMEGLQNSTIASYLYDVNPIIGFIEGR